MNVRSTIKSSLMALVTAATLVGSTTPTFDQHSKSKLYAESFEMQPFSTIPLTSTVGKGLRDGYGTFGGFIVFRYQYNPAETAGAYDSCGNNQRHTYIEISDHLEQTTVFLDCGSKGKLHDNGQDMIWTIKGTVEPATSDFLRFSEEYQHLWQTLEEAVRVGNDLHT